MTKTTPTKPIPKNRIQSHWAILVRTRSGEKWRFYRKPYLANAICSAELASDCVEVMRCVPINAEQFANGIANSGQDKPARSMACRVNKRNVQGMAAGAGGPPMPRD